MSFDQQRIWCLDRLEASGPLYNVSAQIRFRGELDIAALERGLLEIVRRHQVLRTKFQLRNGEPVQVVAQPAALPVDLVDLSQLDPEQREARLLQIASQERSRPFDLAHGSLLRARLARVSEDDHVLLLVTHHIVCDASSIDVFVHELRRLYAAYSAGADSPLPEPKTQYSHYTMWQRASFSRGALRRHLDYWRAQLAGAPTVLELPTDRARPTLQSPHRALHEFSAPSALTERLRELSHRSDSTLFVTLVAGLAILLHRYTGEEEIVIGTPMPNRVHEDCRGLIGFFVNTLPLRIDLSRNPSCAALVQQIAEVAADAQAHQELPFAKLIEELDVDRDLSRNPLFQVMVGLQRAPASNDYESRNGTGAAKVDLNLAVVESETGLNATLEYNTDLFESDRIARMAAHWMTLLGGMAADPDTRISELPLLTATESRELLRDWNDTASPYAHELCLHELFEAQAQRTPDATAVVSGPETLSYRELESRSNQLANYLHSQGVGPERCVAVLTERSTEMVVAFLAVLKAGGVYTPLDPKYPPDRLAYMVAGAGAQLLLTQEHLQDRIPDTAARTLYLDGDWNTIAEQATTPPPKRARAHNAAYLLYTSGSTGKPKGVFLHHGGITNLATVHGALFELGTDDRVLQFASPSFDASIHELVMALTAGAAVCMAPGYQLTPGPILWKTLADNMVTIVTLAPSALSLLSPIDLPALRQVVTSGEACTSELVARWATDRRVLNLYGPTETSITVTWHPCDGAERVVPIGRPISNVSVYLLDRYLQPVPVGVPGELCVGGVAVARGYLDRPRLTAERFVPDPFGSVPGGRLYRTGDLGRFRPDGTIEFLGRLDHQVKLRGFRIELGEVEATLGEHPGVQLAVCMVNEYSPKDKRLVAYILPASGGAPAPKELREHLAGQLPEHMIPATFIELESMPLSPNGYKVDRQALPAPDGRRPELEAPFVEPRSAIERALAEMWTRVLGVEQVGVHDDFFELGGDSLLAAQAVATIVHALAIDAPLGLLLEQPTVADQAKALVEIAGDRTAIERTAELLLTFAGGRHSRPAG